MIKTLKTINYHQKQIHTLIDTKFSTLIGTIAAPLISLYLLHPFLDYYVIYFIIIIQTLNLFYRYHLINKIKNTQDTYKKNTYLKYYLFSIFLTSSILGILFLLAITYLDEQNVFLFFAGLLFLITGAITTLTAIYHAIIIYALTLLTLSIIGFTIIGDLVIYNYMASFTILFVVIFIKSSFKIYTLLAISITQHEALVDKNETFQSLLDSTMEAIIIINTEDFSVIDYNQSSLELFNVQNKTKKELLGLSIFNFIDDSSKDTIQIASRNAINKPYEAKFKREDNSTFIGLISSRNIILNKKTVHVATILDLTSIKEKEQKLFSQSKLASMGEMIANISHQWRQPLSAITTIASSTIIKKDLDKTNLEKSMDKIINHSLYLSNTIETFKNYLKENKQLQEVIIQKEIEEIEVLFIATLKDNGILFTNNINMNNTTKLKLNMNELSQVIINIINNAKDALIQNAIKNPEVTLDLKDQENSILLTIQDNAGGVPQEIKDKIFDPYFTTKHESQGTGLGLHMSYNIVVKSLKGKLYVLNNEHGAKFHIELPLT